MLAIAGGILLAVIALCLAPFLLRGAVSLASLLLIGGLLAVAGAVIAAFGGELLVLAVYASGAAAMVWLVVWLQRAVQHWRNERLYRKYPFFRPWK